MKINKKLIPQGYYCYTGKLKTNEKICPYWKKISSKNIQENGFCEYLGKGDYEINREERIDILHCKNKNSRWSIKKIKVNKDNPAVLNISLLWDKVKMCNIKLPK